MLSSKLDLMERTLKFNLAVCPVVHQKRSMGRWKWRDNVNRCTHSEHALKPVNFLQ